MNIQTAVRADKAELCAPRARGGLFTPLKDFHPGAPRLFQNDTLWPFFERLRKEEPVHLLHQRADRTLLVGRPNTTTLCMSIPSRHLLVRLRPRRHLDPRRAARAID
jgi:hypothetical protein